MLVTISLLMASLFIYYFHQQIKKKAVYYYALATVIACFVIYMSATASYKLLPFSLQIIFQIFSKASLASALFIIVMYIGILPRKSIYFNHFMPLRAELSIIASILTLGHNISYGSHYFIALFTNKKLPSNLYYASIVSLIMIAIMLPLFITSFKTVRKKMRGKTWKKLQKTAYLFYFLMWLHVLLIYLPSSAKGSLPALLHLSFYHIIYSIYIFAKLKKIIQGKHNKSIALSISTAVLIIALLSTYSLPADIFKPKKEASSKEQRISTSQTTTETTQSEVISEKPEQRKEITTQAENTTATMAKNELYKDGEYFASAYGYNDDIIVKVVIEEGAIAEVIIEEEQEDFEYMVLAEDVIYDIIAQNNTNVDTISGATTSSKAIIEAVEKALKSAK